MKASNAEQHANLPTPFKVRIHAKYVILERLPETKTGMRHDPNTGLLVPVSEDYEHHEGPELAVNFNHLKIGQAEFQEQWNQLGKSLWFKMNQGGITR